MGAVLSVMLIPGLAGFFSGWGAYSGISNSILGNRYGKELVTNSRKLRVIFVAVIVFLAVAGLLFLVAANSGSSNGIGTTSPVFVFAFLAVGWLAAGALRVIGTLISLSSMEQHKS